MDKTSRQGRRAKNFKCGRETYIDGSWTKDYGCDLWKQWVILWTRRIHLVRTYKNNLEALFLWDSSFLIFILFLWGFPLMLKLFVKCIWYLCKLCMLMFLLSFVCLRICLCIFWLCVCVCTYLRVCVCVCVCARIIVGLNFCMYSWTLVIQPPVIQISLLSSRNLGVYILSIFHSFPLKTSPKTKTEC